MGNTACSTACNCSDSEYALLMEPAGRSTAYSHVERFLAGWSCSVGAAGAKIQML